MTLSTKSLAGPGYVILNVLKVMNIIGFLAVIAASIVMLIKTSTDSSFFFFDAVAHVVTLVVAMFLIVSEIGLFGAYFARNWPLLSPDHGFVALAAAMIILGLNILACLNRPSNSQKELGVGFWRVVIGAGIVIFILGFLNLIASYLFRDRSQRITARQVRAHGAVAAQKSPLSRSNTSASMAQTSPTISTKSSLKQFHLSTKYDNEPTLPSYHTPSPQPPIPDSPTSKYSRATWCSKKLFGRKRDSVGPPMPVNISGPLNTNPQFAHWMARPDSALHPSRSGESETHRWKAEQC